MSLLSVLFIPILPSPDYRRLVWVLTLLTGACVIYVSFPLWLKLGLGLSLLWPISQTTRPHPELESLEFCRAKWMLKRHGNLEEYQNLHIAADTGFFLLCRFSDVKFKKKRWIVIFYDQLSQDQRRGLHIIETMQQNEKNIPDAADKLALRKCLHADEKN